jgi:ADP-ribose pyrophosphatase
LRVEPLAVRVGDAPPIAYDMVTRRALDAVVIAAHFHHEGETHVAFVSCVRPPLAVREGGDGIMWELPAGLVEPGESFRGAAARELFEEVGARVAESDLAELGVDVFPVAAMIAEKRAFFHVAIDWNARIEPPTDDSPLERAQRVASISLDEALALCASGEIRDEKTELALRRLRDVL